MNAIVPERVIALDIHPLSFGYAVFDGPDELLDWGIKSFRHGVNAVKIPLDVKLAVMLGQYVPDGVVIKVPKTATLEPIARTVVNLAQRRRIPVRRISGESVRKAFPDHNHTKYEIASAIAAQYPELSPRLGTRRKLWQAENYSMSIFGAVALGIAYFMRESPVYRDLRHGIPVPPT